MMVVAERFEDLKLAASPTNWRGRSGRFYALAPLAVAQFSLEDDALYMLAEGPRVLWVGTAVQVIADPVSRTHFRLALAIADGAFCMAAPAGEVDRMTMAWDLEGAVPVRGLSLT